MNRREFLGQTAVGLASLSVASSYASPAKKNVIKGKSSQTFKAKMGDIRAVYMQIGNNMWCDYPTEVMGKTPQEGKNNHQPEYKTQVTSHLKHIGFKQGV